MKKRFCAIILCLCLMLSLFSVSAFAAGLSITADTEQKLLAALNRSEKVDSITITGSFTATEDCMIHYNGNNINYYYNTVITIAEGVTLTVGEGGQFGSAWFTFEGNWDDPLTPNGKIVNNGTVIVAKGGSCSDGFTNNGSIVVKEGGSMIGELENKAGKTVTVEAGGLLGTGTIRNFGTIDVMEGGTLVSWMGREISNEYGGTLELNGDAIFYGVRDGDRDMYWFNNQGTINKSNTGKVFTAFNATEATKNALKSAFGADMIYDGVPIYSAEEFYDAVEGKGNLYSRLLGANNPDRGKMHLMNDIKLDPNLNIGCGFLEIIVPYGVKLTIGDNTMLTAQTRIENGGTVLVKAGATFSTMQGAAIQNGGTITVNEGGTLISRMGGLICNDQSGMIFVNGTMNISTPQNWQMMGRFEDRGGSIFGSGVVNIANCKLSVLTDDDTFDDFSGTVHYYAASLDTQEELNAALQESSEDLPLLFITSKTGAAENEYSFVISDPTVIEDRTLIVMYDEEHKSRNIDFSDDGSLTLVNTPFIRWMTALDNTVELYLDGGTLADFIPFDDLTDISGTEDLILPTPTRDGYEFEGWLLEMFGQQPQLVPAGAFDISQPFESYTFTAQWKAVSDNFSLSLSNKTATSATVTLNNQTASAASVQYILAGYDQNGKMICSCSASVAASESKALTLSFASDAGVSELRAFVLDVASLAPLRKAWHSDL